MTLATDHMQISRRFMEQAQQEFDSGDLLQASEKAWGAAARALKAVAQRRGLRHHRHYDLVQAIGHLTKQTGRQDLRRMFHVAEALRANFYEGWMTETGVRDSIADVRHLVIQLELLTVADEF